MTTLTAQSPAKLNLFLHITGRREDGYHNLQTLFQFIDLCDELTFTSSSDATIQVDFPDKSVDTADNLITRAALLLQQETGCTKGASIHVCKRIPMGGGLGGGSSNAATTLVTLNELWNTGLSRQALATLGAKLGADVPIFVHGHAAMAEGVGDIFDDVELPEPWFLLVLPPCHVPTALLFQQKQLTRNSPLIKLCAFLNGEGRNDFEPVTRSLFPDVDSALQALSQVGEARMTGTGACVFATFQSRLSAEAAESSLSRILEAQGLSGFVSKVVRGMNISPLYTGKPGRQI